MRDFRGYLESGEGFAVTCELVPGRGFRGKEIDSIFRFAESARESGLVHAVSLTDNAGGNPAILTESIASELVKEGVQVIMHFSCKDLSRNLIESRAYSLMRQGIRTLLVMTGDYPSSGVFGLSQPVFDLDSVGALSLFEGMNKGLKYTTGTKTRVLEKTDFFLGAVISPFKWTEASSFMQYSRLTQKAHAGARFFITQLGYDSWKHAELIVHARRNLGIRVPILGSVYLLTPGAARLMRHGEIPGCYVNTDLLWRVESEAKSEDRGRNARRERAALQMAMLKGLGYQGAHIEGLSLTFEEVREIIERAGQLAGSWRDRMEELRGAPRERFYLFQENPREWMDGGPARLTVTMKRRIPSPVFWLMQALHWLLFREGTLGHRLMTGFSRFADERPRLVRFIYAFERSSKQALFDCRECGDCALPDIFFICPEAQCPKRMRVGPCGGSGADGRCEVFPDRLCAWEKVYWRAKRRGGLQSLQFIIPPRDWRLYKTSSWLSYFLKRDHGRSKVMIPPVVPPAQASASSLAAPGARHASCD